ncbi:SEC-C metal-binding domain-containing protein [Dictyobacter aurantiacus]
MPANVHTNADELAQASGQAKSDEEDVRKSAKQARSRKDAARAAAAAAAAVPAGRAARNGASSSATSTTTDANGFPKVGRNDLCPCGSGKKYKKCHGA